MSKDPSEMKRSSSSALEFLNTQTKQHETVQENTRCLWEVNQAQLICECWWLHHGTWMLHIHDLCLAWLLVSGIGQSRVL